jgi:hypothetical protein
MRQELKTKGLNFSSISSHFFAMVFKGSPPAWDIDKEGWMLLAHQGGLTEYTTKLQHLEKIVTREETITEHVIGQNSDYTKDTTNNIPSYAYMCVLSAHVVIGGAPGSRTISLRSDTIRRKRPIGVDNLVSTADTSATKGAIRFALGITKADVQELAKELKLDHTKTASTVIIPEDVSGDDEEIVAALSEEEIKEAKAKEEALWR